jgi:hypothetical protein
MGPTRLEILGESHILPDDNLAGYSLNDVMTILIISIRGGSHNNNNYNNNNQLSHRDAVNC